MSRRLRAQQAELGHLEAPMPEGEGFGVPPPTDEELQILQKYKQTDAYKRLLKRQAQAVRRLERIKANFEKKRKQVNMLTIQRDGQGSSIE
jgi:hypothetical protein